MDASRKSRISFENFERETGLPAIATKQHLRNLGARYMAGEPFTHPETPGQTIIELCFLESDGRQYAWKRVGPSYSSPEDLFEVHKSYLEMETFVLTRSDIREYSREPSSQPHT